MIGYCANDNPTMGAGIQRFATERKKQHTKPVYTYLFARPLPGDNAGSFHSSELWFMFHTLDRAWRPFTEADYVLADKMTDAWTNFAKTGDPNNPSTADWKPYDPENDFTYVFDIE